MTGQHRPRDHRELTDEIAGDLNFAPATILAFKSAATNFDRFCRHVGELPEFRSDYSSSLLTRFADWLTQTYGYGASSMMIYQRFTTLLNAFYLHEDAPEFTLTLPPSPFPGAQRTSRPAEPISDEFAEEVFLKLAAEAMRVEALHAEAERLRVAAAHAPDLFGRSRWRLGNLPPETIARSILERPKEILPTFDRIRTPEDRRIYSAIEYHHPSLRDVFRMLSGVTRQQLMPFFGLLALTSGHVPTSIARLNIHALSSVDTEGRHFMLQADKPRASRMVPLLVEDTGPNSVPDLFERLIMLTERVRAEAEREAPELAKYVFIYRNTNSLAVNALATVFDRGHGSGYKSAFTSVMRRLDLHLTLDDADTGNSLEQLRRFGRHVNPRRLRASRIHKISRNSTTLGEVSDRLDHCSPRTTAGYLRTMATGGTFQVHQRAIVSSLVARFTRAAQAQAIKTNRRDRT